MNEGKSSIRNLGVDMNELKKQLTHIQYPWLPNNETDFFPCHTILRENKSVCTRYKVGYGVVFLICIWTSQTLAASSI